MEFALRFYDLVQFSDKVFETANSWQNSAIFQSCTTTAQCPRKVPERVWDVAVGGRFYDVIPIALQVGAKGAPPSRLAGLDEESNDEQDANYSHKSAAQQLEQSMRKTHLSKDQERGRDRERHGDKGYGQHSAAVTQAARQQVRDRNKQKGAFELNLDGATLLGRRANKPAASVGGGF